MNLTVYCLRDKLRFLSPVYMQSFRRYASNGEDYYKILGVSRKATQDEIRTAFIEKSKKFHPDKNHKDPKNHDKFIKLNEAYTTLSNPEKRNEYDNEEFGQQQFNQQQYDESSEYKRQQMRNSYYQRYHPDWVKYEEYMQRTGRVDAGTLKRIALPLTISLISVAVFTFVFLGRQLRKDSSRRFDMKTFDIPCLPEERKVLKKYFLSLTGSKQRILCDLPKEEFFPELGRRYLISQGKKPEKTEPSKYLSKSHEIIGNPGYSVETQRKGEKLFEEKISGMNLNKKEKRALKGYFISLSGGQQRYIAEFTDEEFLKELRKRYANAKEDKLQKKNNNNSKEIEHIHQDLDTLKL